MAEMAENQHHKHVNRASVRLALLGALDQWERAGCDCCSPTVLDDGIDEIGFDDLTLWERFRKLGIELAQTAQNVIDIETANAAEVSRAS